MRVSSAQGVAQVALPADAQLPARWSTHERVQVYQRVFGVPGGTGGEAKPNREFNDLWLRFVSSVAQMGRPSPSQVLNASALSGESFRATVRELAAQVSPLVAHAWAARDPWQVIDQVSTLELGGATNTAHYRTLAESGGTIIEWLATREHGAEPAAGSEYGLRIAAEQWLASGGAAEADADAMAQPRNESYRLDLSQIVSKYIGETEKNLAMVFERAQRSDAVLLFDEADALFGKRTDVKDSHDRYANVQVNDQLQRIESHEGIEMLTTNGQGHVDP